MPSAKASIATLALNAGEWFRRGLLLICSAPVVSGSILAHRSSLSTLGRVQIRDAGSELFPDEIDKPRVFRCLGGAYIGTFNREARTDDDLPTIRLSTYMPSVAAAEAALAAGKWEPVEGEDNWGTAVTQRARGPRVR